MCLSALVRFRDFYDMWQGLSSLHPLVDMFDFPPESSKYDRFLRLLWMGGGEKERCEKLTAFLKILVRFFSSRRRSNLCKAVLSVALLPWTRKVIHGLQVFDSCEISLYPLGAFKCRCHSREGLCNKILNEEERNILL